MIVSSIIYWLAVVGAKRGSHPPRSGNRCFFLVLTNYRRFPNWPLRGKNSDAAIEHDTFEIELAFLNVMERKARRFRGTPEWLRLNPVFGNGGRLRKKGRETKGIHCKTRRPLAENPSLGGIFRLGSRKRGGRFAGKWLWNLFGIRLDIPWVFRNADRIRRVPLISC